MGTWSRGGVTMPGAARLLGCSLSLAKSIARSEGWPRKRLRVGDRETRTVVYPRALVLAYLDALPAAEPKRSTP